MRAVDQREPFLGGQGHRCEAGALQRGAAGHALAVEQRLALADQHEREVGERREVPGGPDRATAGDHRDDVALQQAEEQLDELDPHARVSAAQRGGEQEHHPAHDLGVERRTGADGMRAQQVDLELGRVGSVDAHRGELSEAGRDAVDDAPGAHRLLHHGASRGDPLPVGGVERRRRTAARDALELLERGHQASGRACSMRRATVSAHAAPGQRSRIRAALAAWP